MTSPSCRLRALRKAAGLSQRELALLLGLRSQGAISDLERARRRPGFELLIACELLFDVRAERIFPRLYTKIERNLLDAARELLSRGDVVGTAKDGHLTALINRLEGNQSDV